MSIRFRGCSSCANYYAGAMNWRAYAAMAAAVLVIWLLGTWVTKYSLEEMALYTPIAVVALGAFAGVILLWVKIVRESVRNRSSS